MSVQDETVLTRRQIEFLTLTSQGMGRAQIAAHCYASPWTVKAYLDSARSALGAKTLAQAVAKALELNLIP